MAGFQQFPIPRANSTTGYWYYVSKATSRKNLVCAVVSHSLIAIALARYGLLKLVIIY